MRLQAGFLACATVVACVLTAGCGSQASPVPLGPKDGLELRPDDLDRVRVGAPAPDFTLADVTGRPVSLSQYLGRFVVLVFYRGHW